MHGLRLGECLSILDRAGVSRRSCLIFGSVGGKNDGYLSWGSSPRVSITYAQIFQSTSGYSALDHVNEDRASEVPVIADFAPALWGRAQGMPGVLRSSAVWAE